MTNRRPCPPFPGPRAPRPEPTNPWGPAPTPPRGWRPADDAEREAAREAIRRELGI